MHAHDPVDLRGLWLPIVTPLSAGGEVDDESLARLAADVLAQGVDGLVALGTTGEPATLTADERRRVVQICDRVCRDAGRPWIVGAGTNGTHRTIDEIERLVVDTSARAALVVVPYYTRPSERAVVEHFHVVADRSPVPVVAYNVPYRTGRAVGAEAWLDVAAHPNVIGLKQSVGALDVDTLSLLAAARADFRILAGDDAFIAPTLLMGGDGAIAAAAHVCTGRFVEMVARGRAGDHVRVRELAAALLPVVQLGFSEPNPAVFKGALASLGRIERGVLRRPMTAASPDVVARLLAAIAEVERRLGPDVS